MDMKLRLRPEEVHTYCKVVPFDMMLGTNSCSHGQDCLTCQYLKKSKYLKDHVGFGHEVKSCSINL